MKRAATFFKRNRIFFLIVMAVALLAFVMENLSWLTYSPFVTSLELDAPTQASMADRAHAYVTDSSYAVSVTDGSDRLLYRLSGGDPDTGFDFLDSLSVGEDATLYMVDSSLLADGVTASSQRLLRFTDRGRRREVLYEVDTLDESGAPCLSLMRPTLVNGQLWFAQVGKDGIEILSLDGDDLVCRQAMTLPNAHQRIADVSFTADLHIAAALKNGDVYASFQGQTQRIYSAREHDTSVYPSMVCEVGYRSDGALYLNDIGLRRILLLENGALKQIYGWTPELGREMEFGAYPLNTGLHVDARGISFLSSSIPDAAQDGTGADYAYAIVRLGPDGTILDQRTGVGLSLRLRITIWLTYLAGLALIALAVYCAIRFVLLLRRALPEQSNTLLVVLITAIVISTGVSVVIFKRCDARYVEKTEDNLSNIADLIEARMDTALLDGLSSPEDYGGDDYWALDAQINSVLDNEVNGGKNVYAIVYRPVGNVVYEVYRDDHSRSVMYPMAGLYEGSDEQWALDNHRRVVFDHSTYSEGSYTFLILPIYNDAGRGIALLEVGSDFYIQTAENNALFRQILILVIMAVVIVMLLLSETVHTAAAFKAKIRVRRGQQRAPSMIRPVAFLVFFTANITTAFLPIYGMELWSEEFPLPAELAAALPLSAELLCSAVFALLASGFISRLGLRSAALIGAGAYVAGNALSAFAGSLWTLVCANSLCGMGSGLLLIAINTWITSLEDTRQQNTGFVGYNAAYLAGMNCGTVVGSLIWDRFGIRPAYWTAVGCALILAVLVVLLLTGQPAKTPQVKRGLRGLRTLFSRRIARYYLCLTVPYLICASFLSYYFPIVAEEGGLSAPEISIAFLISGMVSIYLGPALSGVVSRVMDTNRTMILASFLYAAALFTLAADPTITKCYLVIVIFAVADGFGLAAQSVYFADAREVKAVGESWALGVNSTVESVTSAAGSMIFGGALLLGRQPGVFVIALAFALLLALYVIGGRRDDPIPSGQ